MTSGRPTIRGTIKDEQFAIAAEVIGVAEQLGRTPAQVAPRIRGRMAFEGPLGSRPS